MPVRRYRSVSEIPEPPHLRRLDPGNLREAVELTLFVRALAAPLRVAPGVYRHRSMESLNRQRQAWEHALTSQRRASSAD